MTPGDLKVAYWSTGRIASDQSLNVRYAGPALKASTRYYWRVTVWGLGMPSPTLRASPRGLSPG